MPRRYAMNCRRGDKQIYRPYLHDCGTQVMSDGQVIFGNALSGSISLNGCGTGRLVVVVGWGVAWRGRGPRYWAGAV
jgi:hypothetical protein